MYRLPQPNSSDAVSFSQILPLVIYRRIFINEVAVFLYFTSRLSDMLQCAGQLPFNTRRHDSCRRKWECDWRWRQKRINLTQLNGRNMTAVAAGARPSTRACSTVHGAATVHATIVSRVSAIIMPPRHRRC